MKIETSGFSLAKGKELTGDDYFAYKRLEDIVVAVVCDGVGSAKHGGEASKRTAEFLIRSLKTRPKSWSIEKSIKHFIQSINHILYSESMSEYGSVEMLTTLALVVIEGDRLYGANVGDSRIYLLREEKLTQLSNDHVATQEGMEHVLTAAIGMEEEVTPYYFENNLRVGDRLLLCSDGLYNVLSKEEIEEAMVVEASHMVKVASKKVKDLLPDDTTAVVLKIEALDKRKEFKESALEIKESYQKGEVIDGYRLIQSLAPNNRTWLCEKRGIKYVIKFAPYEALEQSDVLDRFVKEVWLAIRLKAGFFAKAVVPPKRTHRYYIMNYIEGVSLKELIAKKPLGIDDTVELAKFLLKMSQFLIRQDLVHGDIKPENIIAFERKGKRAYKMVDFGSIVEAYSDVSRVGTPSYLAPERFEGLPISEQTEIYAIGVTLYEALTGRYPYGEIEPFQTPTFSKEPKRLGKLNPKVAPWLEAIVMRAIERDPLKRYTHYSEVLYDVEHPDKVIPYAKQKESFWRRYELPIFKVGFFVMAILNLYLLLR